jgi:PAS domain S-box-containing protein
MPASEEITFQGGNSQLRLALEAAQTGIWHWDLRRNKQVLDSSLLKMFGLPGDSWEGSFEDFLQLVHPEDRESVAAAFDRSAEQAVGLKTEFRIIRPDGQIRWLYDKGAVFSNGTGKPEFLTGACVDITERKLAQERLRHSEERLRLILELMPAAVYTCDAQGQITFCNQKALRIWNLAAADISNERFWPGAPLQSTDGHSVPLNETPPALALTNGTSIRDVEAVIERPAGDQTIVNIDSEPLRDESGHVIGAIVVFDDITTRKHTQLQLQEANRRKDEFIATLSHELRNPLAPIENSIEILRLGNHVAPDSTYLLEIMERQVGNLIRLVDDLLEISRISRGKIQLHKEVVDISEAVESAVETSGPSIDAAGHHLSVVLPSKPLRANVDPLRISQVVANLLTNAAKYTPGGGTIELTVRQEGQNVLISVKDTGIGISQEMLPRVFEMFVQTDREHKQAHGGLGIGLALAKNLVEMHGGKIEARSDGLGQGSEFLVRLPLGEAAQLAPPQNVQLKNASPSPKRKILVVDDNADAAQSVGMLLKIMGSDVEIALSGRSAIDLLESYHPQLLLLDLGMPEMSGYEVAERIRRRPEFDDVKLVALTGWGQDEDRRRTKEAGFDAHFVKPLSLDQLRNLLDLSVAR